MKPQKGYYNEAEHPEDLLEEQLAQETPITVNAEDSGNDVIVGEQQAVAENDPYAGTRSYIQELIDASKQRNKELERREKLSRSHEAVAGIADMGRALSNLYFTNQYSPNAFEDSGLSDKARARWEKAKAEREKNRENIMNYHMMQGKLDDNERKWKHTKQMAEERMRQSAEREQRLRDEQEFRRQKEKWRQDFEQSKLEQKEKLAVMNADLKKWAERLKMNRSEIAHTLAGYTIDEYQYIDPKGQMHKVKTRSVYNPKTEQLEAEQSDEIVTTPDAGGKKQTSTQKQQKSLGVNVGGKKLGINVK